MVFAWGAVSFRQQKCQTYSNSQDEMQPIILGPWDHTSYVNTYD